MKLVSFVLILVFSSWCWSAEINNVDKTGLALEGYDPVSYFEPQGPKKGVPAYKVVSGKTIYHFANEKNKAAFEADPKKFEPQFGGWCAYAVADSQSKVEVDPKSFLIQDGRLLLFYNGFLADTRKKWSTNKTKNAATFLKEADAHWPTVKNKEP